MLCTVPFEEDPKDPSIWFLDHNYHESMFAMFKKVNGEWACGIDGRSSDHELTPRGPDVCCSTGEGSGLVQHGPEDPHSRPRWVLGATQRTATARGLKCRAEISELMRRYHPNPVLVRLPICEPRTVTECAVRR